MEKVHAILLTGNDKKNFVNCGMPKCYATLPDQTNSASRVLTALNNSKRVNGITVIGDEAYLDESLKVYSDIKKPILKVYQKHDASFKDNVMDSYEKTFSYSGLKDYDGSLYVSGDAPFRRSNTIDNFVHQLRDNVDIGILLMHESSIKNFYYIFKKPSVPLSKNGKLEWYKSDDIVFLKPKKLPEDLIEGLYQTRLTDKLIGAVKTIGIICTKYPYIFPVLLEGFILRQIYRSFNVSVPFFNGDLEIENLENLVKKNKPYLNAQIVTTRSSDGYIDIDNDKTLKEVWKNFESINSDLCRSAVNCN